MENKDIDNFNLFQVGMLVYKKGGTRPMKVVKFYIDDFSSRFCDRMECTWQEGENEKQDIFNYEDVLITGIHIEQDNV